MARDIYINTIGLVTRDGPPIVIYKPTTIAINASLADIVDIGAGKVLAAIMMPATWTAADITARVSKDGITMQNLFVEGSEYTIPSAGAAASQANAGLQSAFYGWRYIQLRSGTAGTPVTQAAARTLQLVIERVIEN
jgi:hypothetical protein